jgi:hypothetical protein
VAAKIEFVCVSPHRGDRRGQSHVTVHEGRWAYCRLGGQRHEWRAIEGTPLQVLVRTRTPGDAESSRAG